LARDDDTEIEFLGVAWRDSEDAMADFVDEFALDSFEHVNDADERLFAHFGIPYQPAWVFIDSTGKTSTVNGAIPEAELKAILDDLAEGRLPG
jgi:thioredoxin-related protein